MDKKEIEIVVDNFLMLSNDYRELSTKIMIGKSLDMDELSLSVLNRAISIVEGFRTLFLEENVLAAVHLIRIQIDSLIRYNSVLIAENNEYLEQVLNGQQINQFKDLNNKLFSDRYLTKETSKDFKEIESLYNKYCGYIHFGEEHLDYIKSNPNKENVKFRIEVGNNNNYTSEQIQNFVEDMIYVSIAIYKLLEMWSKIRLEVIENHKKISTSEEIEIYKGG